MPVYVSTSCLRNGGNILDVLNAYKKAGIKKVELGPSRYNADLPNKIKQYKFDFIVHNYFPPPKVPFVVNLASQNKTILKRSREQIKKSIEFCNRLNIGLFTFHAGFRADPSIKLEFRKSSPVAPYKKALRTFIESVNEVNRHAENNGVKIAIENNVLSEYNVVKGRNIFLLMCKSTEFENLFREIPSDNLGILLDLGHLKVTSHWLKFDKYEFVDKLKDKVFLIHVHENNGKVDEHKGLDENSWCLRIISKKCFRKVPVSLESTNLDIDEIIQNKKLLENHI
jgi:sugar phosphate isomerase/epimerase